MPLGNLGETMKKLILFLFCLFSTLDADQKVEDLKKQVAQVLPSLHGWCTKEKALHFIDLVLEVKPKVYVEIGVFGGSSLFPVVSALKFLEEGSAIAIDAWDKVEAIRHYNPIDEEIHMVWWGKVNFDYIYSSYLNMLRRYALEEYCTTIKATSEKAASKVGVIDILYIDGNPSEEVSTQDAALYLPKVRSGGYVWMNDCLSVNKQQALDLLLESCDVVKVIDQGNCILLQKR
jgi:hypothetical protein